jgi:hypothetical protein
MALVRQIPKATFAYSLLQLKKRTVIRVTCKKCGEAKTCSTWDGSLQRWERWHRCAGTKQASAS